MHLMAPKHQQSELADSQYQYLCSELGIGQMRLDKSVKRYLILKFVLFIAVFISLYTLSMRTPNLLLSCCCFGALGCWNIMFALNFAHDAAHDSLFASKKWNFWCFASLYTLLGAHPHSWKRRHTHAHHHAPNVEGLDTDLSLLKLLRVLPQAPRKSYHKYQVIYMPVLYLFYSLHWIFIKDPIYVWQQHKNETNPKRYLLTFLYLKLIYFFTLLVLPIYLSPLPAIQVGTGFITMHLVQSLFLSFTFIMTHHVEGSYYPEIKEHTIACSWMANQIKSSNDIWPKSRLANFFFGGFNNHIAHHLFPRVNHFYYPRINERLYPLLVQMGYQPQSGSYWKGVQRHLKLLWVRGKSI